MAVTDGLQNVIPSVKQCTSDDVSNRDGSKASTQCKQDLANCFSMLTKAKCVVARRWRWQAVEEEEYLGCIATGFG
jgi:hypothetical protein